MKLVTVKDLKVNTDDRGNLFEILRNDDKGFTKFGQIYLVEDRTAFTIRAFHRHFKMWDWFCLASGAAKFVFFKKKNEPEIVVIDSKQPKIIAVPPKIWHGWMSLEPETQMISIASESYNQKKPDEERCDPFVLGKEIWQIKAK